MKFKNAFKFFKNLVSKIKNPIKKRKTVNIQKKIEKTYNAVRTRRLDLNNEIREIYLKDKKTLLTKLPKGMTENEAMFGLGRILQGSIDRVDRELGSIEKPFDFTKLDPTQIQGTGNYDILATAKSYLKRLEKTNEVLSNAEKRQAIASEFYEAEKEDIENFINEISDDYYNDSPRISSTVSMQEVIAIIRHNSRMKLIH